MDRSEPVSSTRSPLVNLSGGHRDLHGHFVRFTHLCPFQVTGRCAVMSWIAGVRPRQSDDDDKAVVRR